MCFWRAKVAEQGELVVPKVQFIDGGWLFIFRSLHKNLRRGWSSGSGLTWWKMLQILLLMATACSRNIRSTTSSEGPKVGTGSRRQFRFSPLKLNEQLKTTRFFSLCVTI